MCCSVFQCVAVCCSVLQCIAVCDTLFAIFDMTHFVLFLEYPSTRYTSCYLAVCCSVLQCVAVYCSVLQCVAVYCSVLQCVAVYCSVLRYAIHFVLFLEYQCNAPCAIFGISLLSDLYTCKYIYRYDTLCAIVGI